MNEVPIKSNELPAEMSLEGHQVLSGQLSADSSGTWLFKADFNQFSQPNTLKHHLLMGSNGKLNVLTQRDVDGLLKNIDVVVLGVDADVVKFNFSPGAREAWAFTRQLFGLASEGHTSSGDQTRPELRKSERARTFKDYQAQTEGGHTKGRI